MSVELLPLKIVSQKQSTTVQYVYKCYEITGLLLEISLNKNIIIDIKKRSLTFLPNTRRHKTGNEL